MVFRGNSSVGSLNISARCRLFLVALSTSGKKRSIWSRFRGQCLFSISRFSPVIRLKAHQSNDYFLCGRHSTINISDVNEISSIQIEESVTAIGSNWQEPWIESSTSWMACIGGNFSFSLVLVIYILMKPLRGGVRKIETLLIGYVSLAVRRSFCANRMHCICGCLGKGG